MTPRRSMGLPRQSPDLRHPAAETVGIRGFTGTCASGHEAEMILFDPAYVLAAALALSGGSVDKPVEPSEVACLALNIYHEARGEDTKGQAAVAHVTLNRAADPRYPDSICEVVTQRNSRACQFSWVCLKSSWRAYDRDSFRRALRVALETLEGRWNDPTRGATYFISTRIGVPDWARRLRQTAVIGGHRFFRG